MSGIMMTMKHIELERYFCADCGFTEEYISDKHLDKLSSMVEKR